MKSKFLLFLVIILLGISCKSSLKGVFSIQDQFRKDGIKVPIGMKGNALGIKMTECIQSRKNGATFYDVKLIEQTGNDRSMTLYWESEPMDFKGWTWLEGVHRSELIDPGKNYISRNGDFHPLSYNNPSIGACDNPLARYPFAAITDGEKGIAIGIDMSEPAVFRVGFNAPEGRLYIAYDLGFVPEMNHAKVRFCTFEFNPEWGFRGALQRYYEIFPEAFATQLPKDQQGTWMPFSPVDFVENWEDFGFKFHEAVAGRDEPHAAKSDDPKGILTFNYIEPMTHKTVMNLATLPQCGDMSWAAYNRVEDEFILDMVDKLTSQGGMEACVRSSVTHFSDQTPYIQIINEPWHFCGALFGLNTMPGIEGEFTEFKMKWNDKLKKELFSNPESGVWDGIYIDSAEGWVGPMDFRRDHFGCVQTNLTFDRNCVPGIFKGMILYESIGTISKEVRSMGKYMMCNQNPSEMCFLSPLFDILGTETDWYPEQKWTPMPVEHMFYRRAMCYQKPFCYLLNTDYSLMPHEYVEKYMKRSVAMGFSASCFSADSFTHWYFDDPAKYNMHRDLFKKYYPLCNELCKAGWQPIPYARADDENIHVERFGEDYLTVLNDSRDTGTFQITLTNRKNARAVDMLTGKEFIWKNGVATFTLKGDDAFYFKFIE